jgi:addiction module HigA family antidote
MEQKYLLRNPHPGETLLEDFMKPLGMSAYRISKDIGVPINRIDQIISGKRRISPDTALRLAAYFGTSAEVWIGLQTRFDLMEARRSTIIDIQPYSNTIKAPRTKPNSRTKAAV